jgi:hypothetical protein
LLAIFQNSKLIFYEKKKGILMCKRQHHENASKKLHEIFEETAEHDDDGISKPPHGMENEIGLLSFIVTIINMHIFATTDPDPRANNVYSPIVLQQFNQVLTIIDKIGRDPKYCQAN